MTWILAIAGFLFTMFFNRPADRWWEGYVYGMWTVGLPWFITVMFDKIKNHIIELGMVIIGGYFVYVKTTAASPPTRPIPERSKPEVRDRRPLFPLIKHENIGMFREGDTGPDGEEVLTDLVKEYRKKNIASKGAGCCVFRSAEHSARYQNTPELYDFAEWMVKKGIVGGGYPEKVDKLIPQICKDRGLPVVPYVQHVGGDPKFLELALKTGRMVCVTYSGKCPRYNGDIIAHMVNLVYMDDKVACILDNNFPNQYLWMTRDEFIERWNGYNRGEKGWAFVLLTPPPVPVAHN